MTRILIVPGIGRTSIQLAQFLVESCKELKIPCHFFQFNPNRLRGITSRWSELLSKQFLFLAIQRFRPTLFLAIKADILPPPLLKEIKETFRIPLVNWWIDDPLLIEDSTILSSLYDVFLTSDPSSVARHRQAGAKHVFVLTFACHPRLHRKISLSKAEQDRYGSDVVFVGEVSRERKVYLDAIADFNVKIWSRKEVSSYENRKVIFHPVKESDPLLHHFTGRASWGEEMVKIYNASKIVLNLHSMEGETTNMRTFEITGSGGFLLADRRAHLEKIFRPGVEYDQFEDSKELRDKILYYLSHDAERDGIAKKGYERAHQDHTYIHRLKELLTFLERKE